MTRIRPAISAVTLTLLAACTDQSSPVEPTTPIRLASPPPGPALAVAIEPRKAVLYTEGTDTLIIHDPQILFVGEGEIEGNTAFVEAGTVIQVAGFFSLRTPFCIGGSCASLAYVGWVAPQDGQPDEIIDPMKVISNQTFTRPYEAGFIWTTFAPLYPGRYAIGAGQTFSPGPFARGKLGFDYNAPFMRAFASFVIEVKEPSIQAWWAGSTANAAGWFTRDAKLTWQTRVLTAVIKSTTGCEPVTVSVDTPGQTFTCSVVATKDEVEVTASRSMTIRRDATAPTVTIKSVLPNATADGWNNTDVTVTWECSDATSGPASAGGNKTVSTEGMSHSVDGTCADVAGNTATKTHSGIKIDKTLPTLVPTLPSNELLLNAVVSASPNAADALSGIATATCGTVVTSQAGNFSVTCTATDKAGNTATGSVSYVVKSPFAFSGFLSPLGAPPALNSVKAGSSVPVKFSLGGDKGLDIIAAGSPSSEPVACDASTPVSTVTETVTSSAGGASLTYDPLTDTYTYVWKTNKGWAGSCRTLALELTDGVTHTAAFQFKK